MSKKLRIIQAQMNLLVGDISGNLDKHIGAAKTARDELNADIIVFPELSLTGYPPEDLLLRKSFINAATESLYEFKQQVEGIHCVVGHPYATEQGLFNACSVIYNGAFLGRYAKQHLPNYGVFDEDRYFIPGTEPCVIPILDIPIGILICEDLWFDQPVKQAVQQGARLILAPNASPFEIYKHERRQNMLKKRCLSSQVPIVYTNCVGGQDELLFDGGSMVMDAYGNLCQHAGFFNEILLPVDIEIESSPPLVTSAASFTTSASPSVIPASPLVIPASPLVIPASPLVIPAQAGTHSASTLKNKSEMGSRLRGNDKDGNGSDKSGNTDRGENENDKRESGNDNKISWDNSIENKDQLIYQALLTGLRDYVHKNHFNNVLIGVSGGIDSALTLALAVDALGKDHVKAILMPSRYTSEISMQDAMALVNALDVSHEIISIEPTYTTLQNTLQSHLTTEETNITQQNLQARCRGIILMALSNQTGAIVLSTSNRSEVAVGYATLYGDMVGGLAVLKDVSKTLVYRLSAYRNQIHPVIPQRIIDRAPTAELAPDQKDEDTLPPYPILDKILELYLDQEQGLEEIVAQGFDPEIVERVIGLIHKSEYKRQQASIGIRINYKAFGKDRRYPITSGWWI